MRLSSRGLGALLVGGVAVIVIAFWVTSRSPSGGGGGADQPVLPGLEHEVNAITRVRLTKGDGTQATLEKQAADWIVSERGYTADSSRVRKLLLDLAGLRIIEQKTSDPASYPQIGVEDVTSPKAGGTRIELTEPGKTLSLIIGKPAGTDSSFVRVSGASQSVLATPQVIPDADPRRWLDPTVMQLPESRVKDVTVKPSSGPAYTVTRQDAKQTDFSVPDLPKGRELTSSTAPDSVAGALASLTLDDVRKAESADTAGAALHTAGAALHTDGAGSHTHTDGSGSHTEAAGAAPAQATFHTFDGLTIDVTGRKDGDRRFIALTAQSSGQATADEAKQMNARYGGWELEIPAYQYDAIFQPLDGLLKKPEPKAVKATVKAKGAKSARSKGTKEKTSA